MTAAALPTSVRRHSSGAPLTPSQQLARLVADPVTFSRGLLKHDPWRVQADILRSIATHPRTAVKACHASGKTHVAADALMWWVTRYHDGVVVTTAPTWTQVERLLWGEVHKTAAGARVQFPPLNKTELPLGPENYALGLSTNEGVRFQGWHGRILIILDEAPGVLAEIYEAIEGIRAGGHVHVLLLGNPYVASGPYFDAFGANRANWNTFTISAFDTPNFDGVTLEQLLAMDERELAVAPRPYLTQRRWVREKYAEWGPTHPLWESKVLGQFPSQSEDALFPLAWLERAKPLLLARGSAEPLDAGIDVAGPGEDSTVLVIRQGPDILSITSWPQSDPRGAVVAALLPFKPLLRNVNVDSIGIGYNFALHIQDQGFPVTMVNVGEGAHDKERYANRKAELYWGLRLRVEAKELGGLAGGEQNKMIEKAIGQLAGIKYKHNARGQVVIESKDDIKKRGAKSPDEAEAIMLAFAPPPPAGRVLDPNLYPTIQR
jgi:phage terminase large subunit